MPSNLNMQSHHWLMLIVVFFAGFLVGRWV